MKRLAVSLICLCLVAIALPAHARAIESIGHFDDTYWNGLDTPSGYDRVSVDIKIEKWDSGSDAYYVATEPYFVNGNYIYGGLQTNGNDGSKEVGKMAIFSIWNVSRGIAEAGGTGVPFGGEGEGFSVRLPYQWTVGTTYRFTFYIDQDAGSGDRLWAASVTDLSTGAVSRVGRIYAPVAFGKIKNMVTFTERYLGSKDSCDQISPFQVAFSNVNANSGGSSGTSFSHNAERNLSECAGASWFSDGNGSYQFGVRTTKPGSASAQVAPVAPVLQPKKRTKTVPVAPAPTPQPVAPVVPAEPVVKSKPDTPIKPTSPPVEEHGTAMPLPLIIFLGTTMGLTAVGLQQLFMFQYFAGRKPIVMKEVWRKLRRWQFRRVA